MQVSETTTMFNNFKSFSEISNISGENADHYRPSFTSFDAQKRFSPAQQPTLPSSPLSSSSSTPSFPHEPTPEQIPSKRPRPAQFQTQGSGGNIRRKKDFFRHFLCIFLFASGVFCFFFPLPGNYLQSSSELSSITRLGNSNGNLASKDSWLGHLPEPEDQLRADFKASKKI